MQDQPYNLNLFAISMTNSDIFLNPSLFNETAIPDNSRPKWHKVASFLDKEIEVKEVNVRQYLDHFK